MHEKFMYISLVLEKLFFYYVFLFLVLDNKILGESGILKVNQGWEYRDIFIIRQVKNNFLLLLFFIEKFFDKR